MKKESNVKVYEINKHVSDRFGDTSYLATFITDNKMFTKCTLHIFGGVIGKLTDNTYVWERTYSTIVMCDPQDTFNSYIGHSMAIEKCLDKFNKHIIKQNFGDIDAIPYIKPSNPGNKKKSRWESYQQHLSKIADRYDKTLAKVCADFRGISE